MEIPRAKLLELRAIVGASARAGEPWEDSYKQHRPSFRRLLAREQELERGVAEYFHELATLRLSRLINWVEVQSKLQADTVVPHSDEAAQDEERLLIQVVLPHYEELMFIGVSAAEATSSIPADYPSLTPTLLDNARKSTADMVSGVTDTTRNTLKKAIQSSLARGDNLAQLTDRVREVIDNPVRAQMIAQTETVNAYQSGFFEFATESGAISKEWEAKIGACKLCAPLDGKVLPIDEKFKLSNGREVLRPSAHTRCRCGLIYNYPE